jgi:hypothetical protein
MPSFGPVRGSNPMLRCPFHFLEGKHLDLPHALARDAEFIGEHSKRDRGFGEAPRLEDTALAIVEARQGLGQRLAPIFQLFVLDQDALLARRAATNQSCRSPVSPSSRIGALSEASPPSRRFMSMTLRSLTPSRSASNST